MKIIIPKTNRGCVIIFYSMPFFRNFIYYIDKRNWKYYFLMLALCKGY